MDTTHGRNPPVPLVGSLRHHDYSFEHRTPVGVWRWTTRLDVAGATPAYSVRDIVSPYGLLRDSIPLPGAVVSAMAESIVELRSSFAPVALMGPPPTLSFTVDEGRGFTGETLTGLVTNAGAYGSLLDATLSPSSGSLRLTPSRIGSLGAGEAGSFLVEVDGTELDSSSSPYAMTVTASDPTAAGGPAVLPVTVVVRPKAQIQTSVAVLTFTATRPLSGPFPAVATQTFEVRNVGPSASLLAYEVSELTGLADWLASYSPVTGELPGGGAEAVTVVVVPPEGFLPGTYTETLRVSGYSANGFVDLQIRLVIS
jgi:hypothetical protein